MRFEAPLSTYTYIPIRCRVVRVVGIHVILFKLEFPFCEGVWSAVVNVFGFARQIQRSRMIVEPFGQTMYHKIEGFEGKKKHNMELTL